VIEEGAFFQGDCDMSAAAKGSVVPLAAPLRQAGPANRNA
jgi:hypothetical protein